MHWCLFIWLITAPHSCILFLFLWSKVNNGPHIKLQYTSVGRTIVAKSYNSHIWIQMISRLEYIMLLNLPIIFSSNSFLFHLMFSFLFFLYSPPRSTIKLFTITNSLHYIHWLAMLYVALFLLLLLKFLNIHSLVMIVLVGKYINPEFTRIFIELQQKMATLEVCSWQWLPIAASVCSTTAAHKKME